MPFQHIVSGGSLSLSGLSLELAVHGVDGLGPVPPPSDSDDGPFEAIRLTAELDGWDPDAALGIDAVITSGLLTDPVRVGVRAADGGLAATLASPIGVDVDAFGGSNVSFGAISPSPIVRAHLTLGSSEPLAEAGQSLASSGSPEQPDTKDDSLAGIQGGDGPVGPPPAAIEQSVPVSDLGALDGTNGFKIIGARGNDYGGWPVSTAGDIDGDGFADVLVGQNRTNYGGSDDGVAHVVFGKASGFADVDLNSLGGDGFRVISTEDYAFLGRSVSAAGDVDGDGIADVFVGAPGTGDYGDSPGKGYVVYGKSTGFSDVNANSLGSTGFTITGEGEQDYAGGSLSSAGDVNGDGFDYLIVGAKDNDGSGYGSGAAYVVFGKAGGLADVDVGALGNGGFKISGEASGDDAGYSVSGAGDVNGDGLDDVIVGARFNDESATLAGAAYVVFGKTGGFTDIDLGSLGTDGFKIVGEETGHADNAGWSVSSAGDINGDDFDDVIVGAPGNNRTSGYAGYSGYDVGAAYVVFGGDFTDAVTHLGGAGINTQIGGTDGDVMVAGQGDDTLDGNGGADALRGGSGDDVLMIADTGFRRIDGGSGDDTLVLDGNGIDLDLTAPAGKLIAGIETIDITGNSPNSLTLDVLDVLRLPDTSNTLTIVGDGDDLWSNQGTSNGFRTYALGAATLRVAEQIADVAITSPHVISLADLDGSNGFRLDGIDGAGGTHTGDRAGGRVGNAGDLNGDGFDDIAVGARQAGTGGESYIVFGKPGGFAASLNLAALDGAIGFRLDGFNGGDRSGFPVTTAGDFNGDGFDDLLIGAYGGDPDGVLDAGETYLVFGKADWTAEHPIGLGSLDGSDGFRFDGIDVSDHSGRSVSSAGDVNGDGFDDLIIGSADANPGNDANAGEVYVVFGHAGPFSATFDLATLDGSDGFRLDGIDPYDFAGVSISNAGDVNGDGLDDVIIGAD